jgi:chorismate synthase
MEAAIVILLALNAVLLLIGIGRIIRTIQFSVGAPLARTFEANADSTASGLFRLGAIEDQLHEKLERVTKNQEIITDRLEDIKKNQRETYKMAKQELDNIGGYCYAINESVGDLVRNIDN